MARIKGAVAIKKDANGRLYHPLSGRYPAPENIGLMVENDEPCELRKATTGEDITASFLKLIIVERAHHG